MKVIVDTSVLIDYLRGGTTGKQLFDRIEKQDGLLFIPTIVIFELSSGQSMNKPSVRQVTIDFLRSFKRIELTEEIAMHAGVLYRQLGKHISPQDYIIASSALGVGGLVLTLNKKHFQQISHLNIYPLSI